MSTQALDAPAPRRADRRRSKRIDEILRVATRLLAERGYAATSLDEIAEMIDVSQASLYYYFPSKEALILGCLERIGNETLERLTEAAAGPLTARDRLHAVLRAQVLILTRDQPAGAALFLHDVGLPDAVRERSRALVDRHDRIFRSIIEEGVRTGELHVADPTVARLLMYGAINFIPAWFNRSRRMSPERLADVVADTLVQLLGGGPA